jgi:hypothetical protein
LQRRDEFGRVFVGGSGSGTIKAVETGELWVEETNEALRAEAAFRGQSMTTLVGVPERLSNVGSIPLWLTNASRGYRRTKEPSAAKDLPASAGRFARTESSQVHRGL